MRPTRQPIQDKSVPGSLRRHPGLLAALLRRRGEPTLSLPEARQAAALRRRTVPASGVPRTRCTRSQGPPKLSVDGALREVPPVLQGRGQETTLWQSIVSLWGVPRDTNPEHFRWCAYAVAGLADFVVHSSLHTAEDLRAVDGPLLSAEVHRIAAACDWNVTTLHGVRAALHRARTHPDVDRDLRFQTHLHAVPRTFLEAHPRLWD